MTHVPVAVAPNTLKALTNNTTNLPPLVYKRYPLHEKSFRTSILVHPNSDVKIITALIQYLKIINPEPIIIHEGGDFYPLYKSWLVKYTLDPTIETTFLLDYRECLPSAEDLIYIFKLFDQKPVHFIIIGEYETIPRLLLTDSDLIYLETFHEFNAINNRFHIKNMSTEAFLILDRRAMDLLIWTSNKQDVMKYT